MSVEHDAVAERALVSHCRSMAGITLINGLPLQFQNRASIERAVRLASENLPGGPWTFTLSKQALDPERFSVQASAPGSVNCTSFYVNASDDDIAIGVRVLVRPLPKPNRPR
jgi:hypothetical protein